MYSQFIRHTAFKKREVLTELKVGESLVKRTDHTKLQGVIIEDTQEWNYHLKSLKTSQTLSDQKGFKTNPKR